MQVLDARNAEAARTAFGMTVANEDPGRDFLTGEPIIAKPVTAVAGGRLLLFANLANAENLNAELARMEKKPGPHTGSQVLLRAFPLELADAGGGFPLQAARKAVQMAADGWTETKKKTYIIRVDFPDATGASMSKADLETLYNFGVSNQVFNMSYGKTWPEATASPMVVRLPGGTNTYRPEDIYLLKANAIAAFNALNTGVNLADYDIVCVAFKNIGLRFSGVLFSGLGDLGGNSMWLQGTPALYVVVHELGHNYGLGHAHAWATTDGSVVGTGASQEYGDVFDNMGGGVLPEGYWHMQSKSLLNWLTTSQWTDVSASGTYRIYRMDHPATTPAFSRAVRIAKAASPAEYYWAGYRRAFVANRQLSSGAYLLWQQPFDDTCHLLDTTPGSPGGKDDGAILVGRTYSDSVANVHITPIANGGTGADEWLDITVKLGPFPGNQPPTVGALNGPASSTARTPTTYSVTATDPDGDGLAYSWDFGDGIPVASAASLSHSWLVGGNYTVRVTVSDMKGQVVTRTLSVTVSEPLSDWTLRSANTTEDLKDICTGRNGVGMPIVLAVGGRYAFSSLNGSDWTSAPLNEPDGVLKAVTYDGQRFIACGYASDTAGIWTSDAGVSWTRRYTGINTTLNSIAASGQTAVAVGRAGRILYSTDGGTSWHEATTTATRNFLGVAWGGGTFVAVGANGDGTFTHVFTSTDGIHWTDTSAGSGLAYWQTLEIVKYGKDRFLSSGWFAQIRHSTDNGVSFQTTRTTVEQIRGFAYGNGLFLAAGLDISNGGADINLLSMDGANWAPLPTVAQTDRNAAVFFNNTFITVADGGIIWQSPVFVGSGVAPNATTLAATGVSGDAATLNGSATPNGLASIGFFQWGTTIGYGQATPAVNLGNGTTAVALSTPLGGLTSGQTYHFRAAASNSAGIVYGADMSFATPGGAASPVSTFSGGDPGEGLDLQGNFVYAVNVGGNGAPGLIGDANFTVDTTPGVSVTAPGSTVNTVDTWANPNFGATVNDDRLEQAMRSMRWTFSPAKLTVTLGNLTVGSTYKLQLLFIESCCDHAFDVKVNGVTVVASFRPWDFGPSGTPLVITNTFTAATTTATIELGGGPASDPNPYLGAFTLENLTPANNSLRLTGATRLGDGSFQFSFTGSSGTNYAVLGTTNLALPFSAWSTLGVATETPAGSGQFRFIDTQAATRPMTFYRVGTGISVVRWATRVLGYSSQYSGTDWSAAQALGQPDTYPAYGDIGTAWTGANPDDPAEYLELGYDSPAPISSVSIYETYNPGAVSRISARNPNTGLWVELWSGPATAAPPMSRIFTKTFPATSFPVDALRIELNSGAVPDYNEIDAVSIRW